MTPVQPLPSVQPVQPIQPAQPAVPFASAQEHILAELRRVDQMIRLQVWRARRMQQTDDRFQGLYVSDEEVDALLAGAADLPRWAQDDGELGAGLTGKLTAGQVRQIDRSDAAAIGGRAAASEERGVVLPLVKLARLFGLSRREIDILLICLAPEIDLRYERLFGYLHDDITRKRPSVDLVLNLLCSTPAEKLAARRCLAAAAPLLRHHLIQGADNGADDGAQPPPFLARALRVDARIVAYLLGDAEPDTSDARLAGAARCLEPQSAPEGTPERALDALPLPPEAPAHLRRRLRERAARERAAGTRGAGQLLVYLQGAYGAGKQAAAQAIAAAEGKRLLAVDLDVPAAVYASDAAGFAAAVAVALREALLCDAAPYFAHFDALLADDRALLYKSFFAAVTAAGGLLLLAGGAAWEPADSLRDLHFLRLTLTSPARQERHGLWLAALAGAALDPQIAPAIDAVADRFRLTRGQIADAAATARNLARGRAAAEGTGAGADTGADVITGADLYAACRLHSSRRLAELAQRVAVPYTWDDLVLPPDRQRQLQEIAAQVRHRALVVEQWGFGARLALGKGLVVLFAGPSGTGKTMAAGIMANELGLDLYRIDLSSVVSKYIGETEKNLARIFHEAEASNAILFFDEADALFGKRSEVRDAHDRYANIETSYLLQRMEEYDGLAILASNLQKNMDDAFVRRLHFAVEFPLPDVPSRRRIWVQMWPPQAPLGPDLDFDFLAQRFQLTGGNIRNIALAATYLAAGNGQVVTMEHLVRATQREYQKMGKVMMGDEFGKYESLTADS